MAQAPGTQGSVYGCVVCPARDMTIAEAQNHGARFHPWHQGRISTNRADWVPVTISVEAFNLPQFDAIVEKHARILGRMPVMDGKPRKPRKRGTITLTTQPHEVTVVEAIVAELEAAK